MFFWPKQIKVKVLTRDPLRVRLSEWRADKALVSRALALQNDPSFRLMLDVLQNEHPGNIVLPPNVSLDVRAIYQAQAEGYTICLANLRALAKYDALREPLEATFEPEETLAKP
jgi:hypothetical protein